MMAQYWAESTRVPISYGNFINRFPPNIIKSMRQQQLEKRVDKRCLYCLMNYIYIYIYIYTHTHTNIQTHTHTHTHTHIYIYIYTHMNIHTYTYAHTHTHTYIHIPTHTYKFNNDSK